MEMLEEHRCFEGWQQRWRHDSTSGAVLAVGPDLQ